MTIIARIPHNESTIEVEVLSTFTTGDGRKMASVKALIGKPWITWTHGGPCQDDHANVRIEALQDVHELKQEICPANLPGRSSDLLALALQHAGRPQWRSGEAVYIWGDAKHGGAYLKEEGGFVRLSITHYTPTLLVFWLSMDGWKVSNGLNERYASWAKRAKEALNV